VVLPRTKMRPAHGRDSRKFSTGFIFSSYQFFKKQKRGEKNFFSIAFFLSSEYNISIMPKNEEQQKKTATKIQQLQREEEEDRAKNLALKLGFPFFDLRISTIDPTGLFLIPEKEAQKGNLAIIQKRQKELYIVVLNPNQKETKDAIKKLEKQGFQIKIFITSLSGLQRAWQKYADIKKEKTDITKEIEISNKELNKLKIELIDIKRLQDKLSEPNLNTTQILNIIMASALKLEASDVHLEVTADEDTRLRYRIDGVLQDTTTISASAYNLLLSRIKTLSGLKLNIKNIPQDGRFTFSSDGADIEIRVSIIPAENGENIVMRILDPKTISLNLEDLGIQDYDFKTIQSELKKPNGMIITTGPTGSGKTTLLYAFLKKVNTPEIKVVTLENPIEYHLEGVEQTQVHPDKGYTFASGLRSILRQDPDVILVGEIRDNETAETAINAALTGHLVFSTLHTNDAAGAIPRLVEMEVNANLIPPALNIVVAQRLVRRVCPKCSKETKPSSEIAEKIKNGLKDLPSRVKKLNLNNIKIKEASKEGCAYCNFTGYKGRIGVFELFKIDDSMEKTIIKTPSIAEIRETATKAGMVTMKQDGLLKVLAGITTIDEAERILGE